MTTGASKAGTGQTRKAACALVETPVGPCSRDWLERYGHAHMNVFGSPARVMDHGQGVHIWDLDGNRYLDMMAGIAVNSVGYAHPAWNKALEDQASRMAHISNYFASRPQIELAERLLAISGAPEGSHVCFANSGTEANEAALKMARLHGVGLLSGKGGGPGRIVALTRGFHGRSMGSLSLTWKPGIREPFTPLVPGVEFVPAGDIDAMESVFADKAGGPVAAVIMELIQGEAGVRPLDPAYVSAVRSLCNDHQALMIVDEVQTGMGRTGYWFAFQDPTLSEGVRPDLVTFAKGVAGGFPMGGVIAFGQELSDLLAPGLHGSTFAGNPLAAALGVATLDTIQNEGLLENARAAGNRLRQGMADTGNPLYVGTRGKGLLDAVQLSHPCSHALASWALDHGLIVNAVAPDAIRLAPPLIIGPGDIDQAVGILAQVPGDLPDD